jgi:hypothetical protein
LKVASVLFQTRTSVHKKKFAVRQIDSCFDSGMMSFLSSVNGYQQFAS